MTASRSEGGGAAPPGFASLPWQQPNNTEGTAWERIRTWRGGSRPSGAAYLPFPWASWIDAVSRGLLPPDPPLRGGPVAGPVATVCQHIWALEHLEALRAAGVTDLFWSHATRDGTRHGGLRIHPFPLLPVRCLSHAPADPPLPPADRPLLYSFQGFQPPQGYLSEVRRWLLDLPPRSDSLVEGRGEWHFEQEVYREQVHGQPADPDTHRRLAEDARAYAQALGASCFALCPSGAGPNSIRLWEALGFGAIPVILSDGLRLPGSAELWRQAALFVPETIGAVAALPERLERLRHEPERLAAMQAAGRSLWQRYGAQSFVADVTDFLADPDAVLRARALEPLGEAVELPADEPAELPLRVRRWLRGAPDGERLLIRIHDPLPPALQERLWGPAVRLSADLLAERPSIRWQVSCRSVAVEAIAPAMPSPAQGAATEPERPPEAQR